MFCNRRGRTVFCNRRRWWWRRTMNGFWRKRRAGFDRSRECGSVHRIDTII